jgi:plasmid stabilization system protein ParE
VSIQWLPEAESDLFAVAEWLSERSPRAALALSDRIDEVLSLLRDGLEGRTATLTDGREARRWPVGTLVIYYRRRGDVLEVLRVFDARREPIER